MYLSAPEYLTFTLVDPGYFGATSFQKLVAIYSDIF